MIHKTFGHREFGPSGNFQLVEHRWPGDAPAARALVGPSATLIGWVPFCDRNTCGNLAPGFLKDAWNAEDSSIPLLLQSGNNPPPEDFGGPGGVQRYMGPKDFRAALSIDTPTLFVSGRGTPVMLQFLAMAQVGTTPFRAEYLISPKVWFTMYSGGNAAASGDVSERYECVRIRVFIRIRIGWLGRRAAVLLGNEEPPWASVMLDYSLDYRESLGRVAFWGTAVPAQDHYLGWKRKSRYDMERDMGPAAYHGFVSAGGGMDAMTDMRETHLVTLTKVPVSADTAIKMQRGVDKR